MGRHLSTWTRELTWRAATSPRVVAASSFVRSVARSRTSRRPWASRVPRYHCMSRCSGNSNHLTDQLHTDAAAPVLGVDEDVAQPRHVRSSDITRQKPISKSAVVRGE